MDKTELKPCPFCGGTSLTIQSKHNGTWANTGTHSATVRCNKCHARGSTASCKVTKETRYGADETTKLKAIELWNTRTNTIPVGNGKDYTVVNE